MKADTETVIRDAVENDMVAAQDIYAHYVLGSLSTFEETPPDINEMQRRMSDITGRGMPFLVACVGGTVKGFACVAPFRQRSAYRYTVEDSVYIASDFIGRGLGSGLLEKLIERCAVLEYRQMVAVIGGADNDASVLLHSRMGFRHVGVIRNSGFKLGQWADTIIMQRPVCEDCDNHSG